MCDPTRDDGYTQSRGVSTQKRPYFQRKWPLIDVVRAFNVVIVHFFCLLAPFNYEWEALRFGLVLFVVTMLSITFSYHRNLSHRSFKLPKWLEYPFAYSAVFALQGDPIDWVSIHRFHHKFTDSDRDPHSPKEGLWFSHILWAFDTKYIKYKCGGRDNVMDLKKQWFYRFLQKTIALHILMFWIVLYLYGGLPYVTCGGGVGCMIEYHVTWLVNSACHLWGSRSWKTTDTSRNVWWLSLFSMGESWHNNHHAFESSARQGLEWWQIDITWYLIRLFEVLGLATDVKLPSEFQKQKMAIVR
ncbi:Fatty acid desaturase domain [Arabidopsis suecica]|uniref:Fatty acid desaturase domain n=1 Tax=Arabidopsis suecica TaxID=45249 RepID=A0A8T2C960_ARASU|nr:Fatty acid desaturase domain [Arabidopsis suecica]